LVARLQPLAPGLVVAEATGGFERPAIAALAATGLPVVVANPRQIRDFARATGSSPRSSTRWCETRPLAGPSSDTSTQLLTDRASAVGCMRWLGSTSQRS
jgi:transposase